MRRGFSLSLDVIRFAAAMVVFVAHFSYSNISGEWFEEIWAAPFAHHAVIVFFVLSGFVIAYVASGRENTPQIYFRARLVRLYSVVLPMLVLVPLLDWIGHRLDPSPYEGWYNAYDPADASKKVIAAMTFMHESWWSSFLYFSNRPYWSIAYEFWYYVAFAALCFLRGHRRVLALAAIVALTGLKILLLFPVWLLGVGVWHVSTRCRLPAAVAAACLAGSIAVYVIWVNTGAYLDVEQAGNTLLETCGVPTSDLLWSEPWLAYYVLGLMVALAFVSLSSLSDALEALLAPAANLIRWAAGATFTIYLLHVPMMFAVASLTPGDVDDPFRRTAVFAVTLAALFAVAEVTERRKHAFGVAYDYLDGKLRSLFRPHRSILSHGRHL